MTSRPQHTPGPWKVIKETTDDGTPETVLYGTTQIIHAIGKPWIDERLAVLECSDADADFIVHALNCHDELVEALELITKGTEFMTNEDFKQIRKVLAKAKGKT